MGSCPKLRWGSIYDLINNCQDISFIFNLFVGPFCWWTLNRCLIFFSFRSFNRSEISSRKWQPQSWAWKEVWTQSIDDFFLSEFFIKNFKNSIDKFFLVFFAFFKVFNRFLFFFAHTFTPFRVKILKLKSQSYFNWGWQQHILDHSKRLQLSTCLLYLQA